MKNKPTYVLTPAQKKILDFLRDFIGSEGFAPTVREMGDNLGFKSPRAVAYHLEQLQKKGFIKKTSDGSRNIALKFDGSKKEATTFVPLMGWSAGGMPIYAEENILDWVALPPQFIKEEADVFLLRVKGNSMAPKIEHNDMVIIKRQLTADPGEIIAALIGDETTIKKYLPKRGQIVLQPINPDYEPIIVKPNQLRIQGIIKGVMKTIR
ncbi:MAG: transcriptional repressor LexA [Patescibacteria group bacterium]|nr:transcriptional repressor LexA [Patescibacteria group bacterium]